MNVKGSDLIKYVSNIFTYLGSATISFGCVLVQQTKQWPLVISLWLISSILGILLFLIANGYFIKYFHYIFTDSQAIAAARKAYGTGNGDYMWNVLYKDGRGYFVKAISRKAIHNGSMTGTAVSCTVKKDGTIINSVDNPFSN